MAKQRAKQVNGEKQSDSPSHFRTGTKPQVSEMSDEELLGFKEEGLEEEATPFEMAKPFKKAAIAKAGMEGTAGGDLADAILPDSPLVALGKAAKGIKGIGKFMGAMPKQGTTAAQKELSRFGKDAAVTKTSTGDLGYTGSAALPVMGQISEETAGTFVKGGLPDATKVKEPLWKAKERAAGRPIYSERKSKGVIRKPAAPPEEI